MPQCMNDEFVDTLKQNNVTDLNKRNTFQVCPMKAGLSLHYLRKNNPSAVTGPDEFLVFTSQKMTEKLCQEAATATMEHILRIIAFRKMLFFTTFVVVVGIFTSGVQGNELSDAFVKLVEDVAPPMTELITKTDDGVINIFNIMISSGSMPEIVEEWAKILPEMMKQNEKVTELSFQTSLALYEEIKNVWSDMDIERLMDKVQPVIEAVITSNEKYREFFEKFNEA
ncbi:hypothetical protein JTE90_024516 [Oedothorax gibbosus]|uniref:Uncharacterized protein n=1 Tax=Oedothorax gibbosus TaxID=931172 RepID=A0AAV6TVT9_9ARAC|nr:hypothetical protein JTE90_024516 [Oedothorax gibbosus]